VGAGSTTWSRKTAPLVEIHKKWWISRIARAVHACVADGGGGLVILSFLSHHVYLPLVLRNDG